MRYAFYFLFCLFVIPQMLQAKEGGSSSELLIADFESWPNPLGGQMWVNGGGEPNWSASVYSWVYGANTPRFDPKYVHSGKQSFRLVNAMDPKKLPWASFSVDLGPATDITVEPRKILSLDASKYHYLVFWVKGEKGDEKFEVSFRDLEQREITLIPHFEIAPTTWKQVRLPLSAVFKEIDLTQLDTVTIHFGNSVGNQRGTTFYIDDMAFSGKEQGETPIEVAKLSEPRSLLIADFERETSSVEPLLLGGALPNYNSQSQLHSVFYHPQLSDYSIRNVFRGKGSFRLVNEVPFRQKQSWSTLVFNLKKEVDISGFRYLLFWAKGENGGEKIKVFLKDTHAPDYHPQMLVDPYPQILTKEWQKIIVPLKNVSYHVDLTQIVQIGVEFGSWVGNLKGDILYVDDFVFTHLLKEPQ